MEKCEEELCEMEEKNLFPKYGGGYLSAVMRNCVEEKTGDDKIWEKWIKPCYESAGVPNKPTDPIPIP